MLHAIGTAANQVDPTAGARSIFADVAPTELVPPQGVLFYEGDEAGSLFEVVRGVIRLCRLLPDGRRSITGFAFPGSILGLSVGGNYAYTAEAITPCEIRRCTRGAVTRLLDTRSDFRHRLLSIVSDELCAAQDQMVLLGRKSAPERIVSFLLWIAGKSQGDDGDGKRIDLPMSRTDIADYLGLTTETVSRELTKLKQAGLIAMPTPQHIELLRREALDEIAENGEAEPRGFAGKIKSARWPS